VPVHVAYGDIEKARTVFDWGPAPKPGKGARPPKAPKGPAGTPTTEPTTATEDEAS
jgi:hypothetical protein